jgi:hypothetical protein
MKSQNIFLYALCIGNVFKSHLGLLVNNGRTQTREELSKYLLTGCLYKTPVESKSKNHESYRGVKFGRICIIRSVLIFSYKIYINKQQIPAQDLRLSRR